MKNKTKKLISIALAAVLAISLSVAATITVSAEDGLFNVTEQPVGETYILGQTAVPLKVRFEYKPGQNRILYQPAPITVSWYWSDTESNTDRSHFIKDEVIPYDRTIDESFLHTPSTDEVGVKYYYAVVTYTVQVPIVGTNSTTWEQEPKEAVSDPARIEVVAPDINEQSFTVKKVDGNGVPLAGATIRLETQGGSPHVYDVLTDSNGEAEFTVEIGTYILSEYAAPRGYNATDVKYIIEVTPNGVYNLAYPDRDYQVVTFVNNKIPELNKIDHNFAYMQGYTDGTFLPGKNMTRAEAVVMFSRLLVESMNLDTDYRYAYYPDVDVQNPSKEIPWYANQVCYMYWRGVLADYSRDGKFRPDDAVTRAEFATLAAHFDNLELTDTNDFTDVPNNHWAVKYINSAAAKGWIIGYTDKTFKPEAPITRVDVVTLVNRILNREGDKAYITANANSLPKKYSDLATSHWGYFDIMEASIGHNYIMSGGVESWTAFSAH
ncbi:MAG: S-layer homology domain-containing protein [Oscillospiraceae bacterium]|nr:S-layer homology domain-containing protein [Oscillospiraceae bacterium]